MKTRHLERPGPGSPQHFRASARRWGEDKERGNKPTTEDDGKSALSASGGELAEGPTKGRKGERCEGVAIACTGIQHALGQRPSEFTH